MTLNDFERVFPKETGNNSGLLPFVAACLEVRGNLKEEINDEL